MDISPIDLSANDRIVPLGLSLLQKNVPINLVNISTSCVHVISC